MLIDSINITIGTCKFMFYYCY